MRAKLGLVMLGVALLIRAAVAQGQDTRADNSVRVAIIGQTDSAGRALVERVRARLADATRGRRSVIVPAHDVDVILAEAYRGPTDPIGLQDIREVGKLVAASVVLALVADTVRAGNVEAIVLRPSAFDHRARPAGARKLGSWPAARAEPTSRAIVRAFQADLLYRQAFGR